MENLTHILALVQNNLNEERARAKAENDPIRLQMVDHTESFIARQLKEVTAFESFLYRYADEHRLK